MVTLLLHLLRLLPMLCSGHHQVALENLALRHQLAVYKKTVNRPKLLSSDRLFWVALSRVWAGWRQALVIVSPNTVLRWQRRRFREYWARLSARPAAGRPRVNRQVRALVVRMAEANPLWGAPRIHGELQMLGIDVAERTGSRLVPKRRSPPVAEPLRGAAHRLHPARVSESRPRPWRTAPAPPPDPLLRVLSPGAYSPLARQGCARCQARRTRLGWEDRAAARSRRPSPSLPTAGRVGEHSGTVPQDDRQAIPSSASRPRLAALLNAPYAAQRGRGPHGPIALAHPPCPVRACS